MVWTLELASYLDDAPWPANKSELIDYATRTGAPKEVINNLLHNLIFTFIRKAGKKVSKKTNPDSFNIRACFIRIEKPETSQPNRKGRVVLLG